MGAWLLCLWLAGGASKAGETGQLVTRTAAWAILLVIILSAPGFAWRSARPVVILLGAAVLMAVLQLVPLPPALWMALPGRDLLADAATLIGEAQPWRPLSVAPDLTLNALSSLIVPVTTLALMLAAAPAHRWPTTSLLLGLIFASACWGLAQFSGASFGNPFVNDAPGEVSSSFANRNHFALFAAIGLLIVPAWAFRQGRASRWRLPAALGLVLLLGLIILATGSRAGLLVGAVGLLLGLGVVRREVALHLSRLPRWAAIASIIATLAFAAAVLLASIAFDRAVSLERLLALDTAGEMRSRALPVILALIAKYFPFGSGVGTFDVVFRIDEPFTLLKRTYFNHAHNDFLEVLIEAGLPALLLMSAALLWWVWASVKAWRSPASSNSPFAKLGSGIVLLVLISSVSDYPARTPMIMALVVIAAVWLANGTDEGRRALPGRPRATADPEAVLTRF